jgi:hypothetical protein
MVNQGQIRNAEEKQTCSESHRTVRLSTRVYHFFRYFTVFQSLVYLGGKLLWTLQLVYQSFVHQ